MITNTNRTMWQFIRKLRQGKSFILNPDRSVNTIKEHWLFEEYHYFSMALQLESNLIPEHTIECCFAPYRSINIKGASYHSVNIFISY